MKRIAEIATFAAAVALVWACQSATPIDPFDGMTPNAVPLRWTVETSRVKPEVFEAYHGETLSLEVTFQSNGKPFAGGLIGSDWNIYWQTNGMDQAWWSAPVNSFGIDQNKITAEFKPEMDPGASVVNGFIGYPGANYRAAFIIRFRNAPGANPNTLTKPVPILDLANTTVINAPWPTDETIASTIRRVIEEDGITAGGADMEAVTNLVDDAYTAFVKRLSGKRDIGDLDYEQKVYGIAIRVSGAVGNEAIHNLREYIDRNVRMWEFDIIGEDEVNKEHIKFGIYEQNYQILQTGGTIYEGYSPVAHFHIIARKWNGYQTSYDKIALKTDIPAWAMEPNPPESMPDDGVVWDGSNLTTKDGTKTVSAADVGAAPASIAGDVQSAYAWSQNVYRYMTANTNAWFAGTNYVTNAQQAALRHKFAFEEGMDLGVVPCSMALWEIRDGEKVCVWDQRDWDSWYWAFKRQQLLVEIDPKIDAKADKAWSHHTATGIDNPAEDTVWLDTPKVVLSAGYAWQRNQTTRGSFFTLVNRGGLTSVGSNRDGSYFEIKDDEGNSIFKISKTDSYMADADAASVRVEDSVTLTVNYPSTVQPVAYCCTDLAAGDFKEETDPDCPATVVWSHSGSTYTVRATPKVPDGKLFLFAKVRVEGQTKNEFAAPVEFTKIVIGGVTYTVGTATINGNTVLTLTR